MSGLVIPRHFTSENQHPFDAVAWEVRDAVIVGKDGEPVFEARGLEFPAFWSQRATDIVASKYFRVVGGKRETSVAAMIRRVSCWITGVGVEDEYFNTQQAEIFREELQHILLHQYASFNSPVWFNVGVQERPQSAACFILDVEDSMKSILEWYRQEGMIFKGGSGSGVNISKIRAKGLPLSNGGVASGALSFACVADANAGAIKSGGSTRRAAKLLVLDVNHPEIEDFIRSKCDAEKLARTLMELGYGNGIEGGAYDRVPWQNANNSVRVTDDFMACITMLGEGYSGELFHKIVAAAHECGCPGLLFSNTINAWHTTPGRGPIVSANPCQPGEATVLTPEGIRTFDDIDIGSVIWSGKRWTRVTNKVATGYKHVYKYQTAVGIFIGTEEHQVLSGGIRMQVQNAETVDRSNGPVCTPYSFDRQAMVDGLALGDGTEKTTAEFGEHRRVLQRYLCATEQLKCGFLRGLYSSANGSIAGGRVTLKATSFDVISAVQLMLSSLGIPSYFTTNNAHDVAFKNGMYTCKESYDLHITTGKETFSALIGFIQPEKQVRLDVICTSMRGTNNKESYEIRTITPLGCLPVFDITVDDAEHTYWTGGLLVSNCGEFLRPPNEACNLASLNLLKFLKDDGSFDIPAFTHTVDVMITAMDILIDRSSYPTDVIAQNSCDYRPLGLGYANLGALLMVKGLPYDSNRGRAYASALTALLTGEAYRQSGTLAEVKGAFPYYERNRQAMLDVIHKHMTTPMQSSTPLGEEGEERHIFGVASNIWTFARIKGEKTGFRNCQVSVLAPCGTISFMMDCDTTGIEPCLGLVTTKKLVGGGEITAVNSIVPRVLTVLGYTDTETKSLYTCLRNGVPFDDIAWLNDSDGAVLASALGNNPISWQGHIKMVAAVQPFISGGISKTINMPHEAKVQDVYNAYTMAWKMGLKAISIYRDGSKGVQPVTVAKWPEEGALSDALTLIKKHLSKTVQLSAADAYAGEPLTAPLPVGIPSDMHKSTTPQRHRLPNERRSLTHKFSINTHEGYITVGLYDDGSPGELFVRMAKEGSTLGGLMDAWATAMSIALQYGVPLEIFVAKFKDGQYEPRGFTGNPEIRTASSITDYIVRWLELKFAHNGRVNDLLPTVSLTSKDTTDVEIEEEMSTRQEVNPNLPVQWGAVQDVIAVQKVHNITGVPAGIPLCHECGNVTIRNGSCCVCTVCGTTTGCS